MIFCGLGCVIAVVLSCLIIEVSSWNQLKTIVMYLNVSSLYIYIMITMLVMMMMMIILMITMFMMM